jgi:hypothetical protein
VDTVAYRKYNEDEIRALCANVTPRVRDFMRAQLYEQWPEDFLRGSDGVPVDDAGTLTPPTEDDWLTWANERIPYEQGNVPQ